MTARAVGVGVPKAHTVYHSSVSQTLYTECHLTSLGESLQQAGRSCPHTFFRCFILVGRFEQQQKSEKVQILQRRIVNIANKNAESITC